MGKKRLTAAQKQKKAQRKQAAAESRAAVRAEKERKFAVFKVAHARTGETQAPAVSKHMQAHQRFIEKMKLSNTLFLEYVKKIMPSLKREFMAKDVHCLFDLTLKSMGDLSHYSGKISMPSKVAHERLGAKGAKRSVKMDVSLIDHYDCDVKKMYDLLFCEALLSSDRQYFLLQFVIVFLKNALFAYMHTVRSEALNERLNAYAYSIITCYERVEELQAQLMADASTNYEENLPWFIVSEPFYYQMLIGLLKNPEDIKKRTALLVAINADFQINLAGMNHSSNYLQADTFVCSTADRITTGYLLNPFSMTHLTGDVGREYHPREFYADYCLDSSSSAEQISRYFLFSHTAYFNEKFLTTNRKYGIYSRLMQLLNTASHSIWRDPNLQAGQKKLSVACINIDSNNGWLYHFMYPDLLSTDERVDIDYLRHMFLDLHRNYNEKRKAYLEASATVVEELKAIEANSVVTRKITHFIKEKVTLSPVSSESLATTSDEETEQAMPTAETNVVTEDPWVVYQNVLSGADKLKFAISESPSKKGIQLKLSWLTAFNAFHEKHLKRHAKYSYEAYQNYFYCIEGLYRATEAEADAMSSTKLLIAVNLSWLHFVQIVEDFLYKHFEGDRLDPYSPAKRCQALLEIGQDNITVIEYLMSLKTSLETMPEDGFVVVGEKSLDKRKAIEAEHEKILEDRERARPFIPRTGVRKPFECWSFKARRAKAAEQSIQGFVEQRERLSDILSTYQSQASSHTALVVTHAQTIAAVVDSSARPL